MSKIGLWKNIFGQKEKVPVNVGGRTQQMTRTQSLRFNELNEERDVTARPRYCNPLANTRYNLEDAAFRLMISEDELLKKAAAGRYRLYVDAAGLTGRWRRRAHNGEVTESLPGTIASGLLRLRTRACHELAVNGHAEVSTLDLCERAGNTDARLDDNTLLNLFGWGPGDKQFFPDTPIIIDKTMLLLLAPLS